MANHNQYPKPIVMNDWKLRMLTTISNVTSPLSPASYSSSNGTPKPPPALLIVLVGDG